MDFPIHLPFIALSFIVGLIVLFSRKLPFHLALFPFFLLFTLFIEIKGLQLSSQGKNNTLYFNIYSIVSFDFYLYLIFHYVKTRVIKILIVLAIIGYSAGAMINLVFFQGLHSFNTLSYGISSLLIIIFACAYFLELFFQPKSVNLVRESGFWIITGLLIFTISTLPLLGMANFISQLSPKAVRNFGIIIRISGVLLYLLFTIAFVCRINIRKST